MASGVIKKWIADRGFGFIRPDDGGTDVFVHATSFPRGVEHHVGARVSYDIVNDERSGWPKAVNARLSG
ncbi:cold-shock protein [Bradyrhizobium sp. DASA03076]|uniref:cold-shock protein n=1 Tax=Bradyrhizobium sp. BLXBL-03 TaxID=3395916 RepID=UPI003F70E3D2